MTLCFQTTNARFVNLVINHPMLRRAVSEGTHDLDSTAILENPENLCYACHGGVLMLIGEGSGVFEAHVFLLPGSRGAAGLAFGKTALRSAFTDHNARKITAKAPLALPAVAAYARRLGFVSLGRDPKQPVELFTLKGI